MHERVSESGVSRQRGEAALFVPVPSCPRIIKACAQTILRHGGGMEELDLIHDWNKAPSAFDWSGIEGADGAPLPWPAAGKGYGGEEKPSAEDVAQRVALLSCLPWNVQSRLDASVAVTFTESTNSGKG